MPPPTDEEEHHPWRDEYRGWREEEGDSRDGGPEHQEWLEQRSLSRRFLRAGNGYEDNVGTREGGG